MSPTDGYGADVGVRAGENLTSWLLDSDPAIRWQVLRDLAGAPVAEVAAERARVATGGWGARDLGIDPSAVPVRRILALVRDNCTWEHAGQAFFDGEVEPCINGRVVALGAYFGVTVDGIVARLLGEELADGGWNCETENGSVRSSFHTTMCVLDGLHAYEQVTGGTAESRAARRRGEEYLLERQLSRRLSTGNVADPAWLRFSFPTQWHYDVLRGLDYFREVGGVPDPRLAEAISLVRDKRQADGTWLLENTHPGAVHFAMENGDGQASRWNTLRALRVLDWYDKGDRLDHPADVADNPGPVHRSRIG
jgi:hypothetical protein